MARLELAITRTARCSRLRRAGRKVVRLDPETEGAIATPSSSTIDPMQEADYATSRRAQCSAPRASPLPKLCDVLERRSCLSDDDRLLLDVLQERSNPAAHVTLVAIKLTTASGASGATTAAEWAAMAWPTRGIRRCGVGTRRYAVELRCRGGLGFGALPGR